ncbi:MAG: hypothetical protein V1782_04735 [Pseudomonadota bacterium]
MKILARELGRIGRARCHGGRIFFFRPGLLGRNDWGGNGGEPGQPFPVIIQEKIPAPPHQGKDHKRSDRRPEPGKEGASGTTLTGKPNNGFFRVALRTWHLPARNGRWHHLLKPALVAKEESPAGVAYRRSRFFTHHNGMFAFRTRHGLAGMAVFNLNGISAFIAVKNHPASSTKKKQKTPTTVIGQNKKILHIFRQDQEHGCKKKSDGVLYHFTWGGDRVLPNPRKNPLKKRYRAL